jgi:flagellar motility protein MotE (MotC chaperone)
MLMATVAFGLRAIDLYTGFGLLNTPVQAQEQDQDQAQDAPAESDLESAVAELSDDQSAIEQTTVSSRAPIIVGLPDNEEMELITQLRQRRVDLESRATSLDLQENLLASTEKRINEKIEQLKVLEDRIKTHLRLFEDKETEQLQSIVRIYETMKPKEAAPRFEALSLQTQLDLVQLMNPRKVALLMEKMTPQKASTLTTELATKAQPPGIDDIQGSN